MSHQITWESRGSIIECSGLFDIGELQEANGILHGHEGFDRHTYQIWDLLNADMSTISEEDMLEPSAMDDVASMSTPRMKIALVVNDDYAVKLCESYSKSIGEFNSKWECRLFDSMGDARQWARS
jgi:hypothetical protein